MYGGGAILVREVSRRAGRGYVTMLILGVAYAIVEEGLVDQLLFNPAYITGQDRLMQTVIPGAGVDAWLTLILLAMHAIWSICVPIILVEAIFAHRGSEPWLGKPSLAVVAATFVAGAVWLGYETYAESGFLASTAQLAAGLAAVAVVAVVVVVAFAAGGRERSPTGAHPPHPLLVAGVSLAASSLFMLTELLEGWSRPVACLVVAIVFLLLLGQWSRRTGWSPVHTLAAAAGGTLTYAWLGVFMEPETGPRSTADHIGTGVLMLCALGLLATALRSRLAEAGAGRWRDPQ